VLLAWLLVIYLFLFWFTCKLAPPGRTGGVDIYSGSTVALLGSEGFTFIKPVEGARVDSSIKKYTLVLVDVSGQSAELGSGIIEDVPSGSDIRHLLEGRLAEAGIRVLLWSQEYERKGRSLVIESPLVPGLRAKNLRYFLFADEGRKLFYPPPDGLSTVSGV
jgi:hypothetical protein